MVEDWQILRMLSLYRLLLVTLLVLLRETGLVLSLLDAMAPLWFQNSCTAYALAALLLMGLVQLRRPGIAIQGPLHFLTDTVMIGSIVYASGGVPEGLGALLITPAVGCAMVASRRTALAQAAVATLMLFAEEVLRHSQLSPMASSDFTGSGVLGMILFGSSFVANAVAQRARRSEALAQRVGTEFEDLSLLNDSIIQTMQTGVIVVDRQGRVRTTNGAAQRLLAPARLARDYYLRDVSPALADRLDAWHGGAADAREPVQPQAGAVELLPRFSHLSPNVSISPVLILLEDAAQLREQAQQMKLASLGRLSASIAHEIRNPLSAIAHASQLLAESPHFEGQDRRLLSMIGHHSERIDKIVRDVLALSRREAASRSPILLRDWLVRAIARYHESHPEGTRPVDLGFIPDTLIVLFDPNHLQQVLFNLWDNAYEHGGRDGRIITLMIDVGRNDAGQDWLDVSDDGPGVPADLQEQIFEPFFTTAHGGTGLGLYLVRELCEYNQARIAYRPQRGGASFRLTFSGGGP